MASRPNVQVNVPPVTNLQTNMTEPLPNWQGLSVNRALQFTPFTASVLPVVDRIPVPELSRVREDARVAQSNERKMAQALLQQPQFTADIAKDLAQLLNRDPLPIDFKLPPMVNSATTHINISDLPLTPLARSILSMSEPDYRYPTPPNDTAQVTQVHNPRAQHQKPVQRLPTPTQSDSNAFNARPQLAPASSSVQKSTVVVNVPAAPVSQSRTYNTVADFPQTKRLSPGPGQNKHKHSQKQQADAAVNAFDTFLNSIFEAQEHRGTVHSQFFDDVNADGENGTEIALNSRTLDKLHSEMRKLQALRQLGNISQESLRHLQQICEPCVEVGQSLNVKVNISGEDDSSTLQNNLSRAHSSACNAIVVIYTMLAYPNTEDLLHGDLLRWTAGTLVNIMENCVVSTVEARADAKDDQAFRTAKPLVEPIKALLNTARKLLEIVATACITIKGGNAIVNTIEFLAAKLVFVQSASTEKNSVLNLSVYDVCRKSAMTALSKIYARFPGERAAIQDEVLTSLDKLPSTSRSARTFHSSKGKAIQLISALFMQLIQTTAMSTTESKSSTASSRKRTTLSQSNGHSQDSDSDDELNGHDKSMNDDVQVDQLTQVCQKYFVPASKSTTDMAAYLVAKASKATKSGDSPYRNILNLLIEDLVNVLDDAEWSSAEMLLNVLAARMLWIAENEKAAFVKNMALESLGVMGSAITKLKDRLRADLIRLVPDDSQATTDLIQLKNVFLETGNISAAELFAHNGPFAMTMHHMASPAVKSGLLQQSARQFMAAYTGQILSQNITTSTHQDWDMVQYVVDILNETGDQQTELPYTLSRHAAEMAYLLCVVHMPFCRRLGAILKALSSSLSSDQAQVRSRSLKSISVILEIDSSLLDRDQSIAEDVFKCGSGDSAIVRDSALSLIARFIIPRGGRLQEKGLNLLLESAGDEKVGVQKRAIGHLKDIYLVEKRPLLRRDIILRFLIQLTDHEDSIVSLTQQSLEEILIKPVLACDDKDPNNAAARVAIDDLAITFMNSATEKTIPMLQLFFSTILKVNGKNYKTNAKLCSRLVQALFDRIVSTEAVQAPLVVLTALAEADPYLVTALQLSKLQIYLEHLQPGTDTFMFRAAVSICRLVLPTLSDSHKELMFVIQNKLMAAISKMGRREELDVIMQCLAKIDSVIHNTDRLIKLMVSLIKPLKTNKVPAEQLKKILRITGAFGKYIDLDAHTSKFTQALPDFKAKSLSTYLANLIVTSIQSTHPVDLKLVGLESLGSICQFSPGEFNNPNVRSTFFEILSTSSSSEESTDDKLKAVVLKVFDELYAARAAEKNKDKDTSEEQELKQMGGDSKSRDQDSAIQAITPPVVEMTLKISLTEISDNALPAARTLASISHQGLIHPKQCLGAFVAFGTSSNSQIAAVGHQAQRLLHEQHESHCEREYMSALSEAFKYQIEVVSSPFGAIQVSQASLRAKLGPCFDIITTSNNKYVKKFLSGLVSRLALDRFNSDNTKVTLEHVMFTRFMAQNIAFFDYKKLDELLHIILQLELTYGKSGAEIAQLIETAQLDHPDMVAHEINPGNPELGIAQSSVEVRRLDPALAVKLNRLGPAAVCLTLLIETRAHLLRQYGIQRDVRVAMKNNKQAQESNKVPTKVHGITGERFWQRSNAVVDDLQNSGDAVQLCQNFLSAINVDDDLEMPDVQDLAAVEEDSTMLSRAGTPGQRKRKYSGTPGPSPIKRARGRPRKSENRRSSSVSTLEDDPDGDFE